MASRRLDDLAQPVRRAAQDFIVMAELAGIDLLIYCTLRSNYEQANLYAIGRTRAGSIVTNAKPGESLHNPDNDGKAWAFDCVPMIAGKPQWNDVVMLNSVGNIGEKCGLEWAGGWAGTLRERVHFQIRKESRG